MYLEQILAHNRDYVRKTSLPILAHTPQKKAAIVTCMDCRLTCMFEDALGIERGDVIELRTAGATISPYDRKQKYGNDLIRSLAASIYLLGVQEVIVIGHTQCGLSRVDANTLRSGMQQAGIQHGQFMREQGFDNIQKLLEWVGAYNDVHINVQEVVKEIRNNPFLPDVPVHGLIIDIETGKLEIIEQATTKMSESQV